jgi:hypothetical protein
MIPFGEARAHDIWPLSETNFRGRRQWPPRDAAKVDHPPLDGDYLGSIATIIAFVEKNRTLFSFLEGIVENNLN